MVCLTTALGIGAAAFLLYKLGYALWMIFYPHVLAKRWGHTLDLKSLGKWAVVTGATDGIGKGYAKELAKRGINVYLISRSEEKLKATAEEIRKVSPKVEIKVLAVDFATVTPNTYKTTIANALKDIEIGILINNVGIGYGYPEQLHKVENGEELLRNITVVNCDSAVQMSRVVLPSMVQRKKGAIITLSSAAAFCPMPLLSVYSATKIFLEYLSNGLDIEYANSGIIFQVVHPFYVVTKLSGLSRSSFWVLDPDGYAANALDTIGLVKETSGCFSHELQRVGMKLLIAVMPNAFLGERTKATLKRISANYHKKQERERANKSK